MITGVTKYSFAAAHKKGIAIIFALKQEVGKPFF
jgi:hypothetical protein